MPCFLCMADGLAKDVASRSPLVAGRPRRWLNAHSLRLLALTAYLVFLLVCNCSAMQTSLPLGITFAKPMALSPFLPLQSSPLLVCNGGHTGGWC
jgi:hypothetical protein